MKIALVHDYLTQKGGAERVFEMLCQYFPTADIFTSLYDPQRSINLGKRLVKTTSLQKIPGATKYFRMLAPFYFSAFRSLDLQDYDLIISSSTSFAKAVRKRPDARHICFCHSVTRFLWDTQVYIQQYTQYKPFYALIKPIFSKMKEIDLQYAQEPDVYIANSRAAGQIIKNIYKKKTVIVNCPIDVKKFVFSDEKEDFYLVSSRILSYKRIDIIVEAFNWLGWSLLIAGDGPERKRLESQALPNIQFLGYVSDAERCRLMAKARSVIVAAREDYGLVPVEANASGTPVICYGAGGVLDTQIHGKTGVFFKRQTPESLQCALLNARDISWNYEEIRNHALSHFTEEVFFNKVNKIIEEVLSEKKIALKEL
jgi:glycosyltransferase involved in cell wall biosynthesis